MKTTDLKSLSNTIASVVDPLDKERAQMLQEGFLNSLTEKARQIASKEMEDEDEEEEEDEMEDEGEEEEEKPSSKKKAKMNEQESPKPSLKPSEKYPTYVPKPKPIVKVKPKKLTSLRRPEITEEIELAEKAAPGYEDWASDPKVKASFKKQYGKRWKEVMYGHSWNLAKQEKKVGLDEEMDQLDEISDALKSRAAVKARQQVGTYSGIAHGLGGPEQKIKAMKMARKKLGQARKFGANLSEEDLGLEEGYQAKRMRVIRKAIAKKDGQGLKPEVADFMKRSFKRKRRRDETLSDGRGAVGAMETRARRKTAAMKDKLAEEWGGGFQSYNDAQRQVQAGLRRDAAIDRRTKINDIKAVLAGKMSKKAFKIKHKTKFSEHPLTRKIIAARINRAKARRLAESEQLDEAGYKRLGRIKGAAYKAELASRGADPNTSLEGLMKTAKLKRAAAELTDKVAAGMARRGGASPEAVRTGGSGIGKSGKYTKKAGKLANMRDKAIAAFHAKARTARLFDKGEDQSGKRERQQAQAAFEKKARTGDFGQDNQAALRARSNFQKRFGRLKGK